MKKILYIIIFLLVIAGGTAAYGYNWYTNATTKPISESSEVIDLTVADGETLTSITPTLLEKNLIKSDLALKIYLKANKLTPNIKAGEYKIPANTTLSELIDKLEKGTLKESIWITVKEGLTANETADVLSEELKSDDFDNKFKKEEFLAIFQNPDAFEFDVANQEFLNKYKPEGKTLEGFLFPDTYNVDSDSTAMNIVNVMIDNMIKKLEANDIDPSTESRAGSFYNSLILASIIERESKSLEDKKIVSDIFLKRLEEGGLLGSDVTILYELGRKTPEPTGAELEIDSPYNTRKNPGLPPTPIVNMSINALIATYNPTENNYYYFIADSNSIMRYAETLEGHQSNIDTYGLVQ